MELNPKFVTLLRDADCVCNELVVPHSFCVKHCAKIPLTVKRSMRNGYEMWLDFDKKKEKFIGLHFLYSYFCLKGGQSLFFEYAGGFVFKVSIFGFDGSEIEYPKVVHHLQTAKPRQVSLYDGGWSFVSYVSLARKAADVVVVPQLFVDRVGDLVPDKLELVVSSGQQLVAHFKRKDCEISGLASLCNMLSFRYLNQFHILHFNYVLGNRFNVTAFDDSMTETPIYPKPYEHGETEMGNSTAFEILVQPFHMLRYCHGVDVSVDFRDVRDWWNKLDYITAYIGNRCWTLQVRKRANWKRTTIHDGWIEFRNDLDLAVGDVCAFHWRNDTVHNFDVCVLKAVGNV
ncbi:hypothetical protein POM88_031578 [Heracleum sosnowskyi]|uniref:TF-B3 domain-containing protein n=1 Tax=Heracleum sosnowskyi TaxID=360622 RepID=A0AAD8I0L6_9APIA|nr:hypothetical protein POM88_031578 [Heracleum sosnowskyi]